MRALCWLAVYLYIVLKSDHHRYTIIAQDYSLQKHTDIFKKLPEKFQATYRVISKSSVYIA